MFLRLANQKAVLKTGSLSYSQCFRAVESRKSKATAGLNDAKSSLSAGSTSIRATMYRNTVDKQRNSLSKSLFPSSSPDTQRSNQSQLPFKPPSVVSKGRVGPSSSKNVLSSNQSAINSHNNVSNGAAAYKQTGRLGNLVNKSAFEHTTTSTLPSNTAFGHTAAPSVPKITSSVAVSTVSPTYYEDDEFDSDIDLDAEHSSLPLPVPAKHSLPPQQVDPRRGQNQAFQKPSSTTVSRSNPPTYQQPAPRGISTSTAKSQHATTSKKPVTNELPPSSVEVFATHSQWPSSPPEHLLARNSLLQRKRSSEEAELDSYPGVRNEDVKKEKLDLNSYSYNKDENVKIEAQREAKKEKKGRKLPWQTEESRVESADDVPWNLDEKAIKANRRKDQKARKQVQAKVRDMSPTRKAKVLDPTKKLIELSDEQKSIIDTVLNQGGKDRRLKEGKSIFFTGSAGTGKSVLLRELIRRAKKKYERHDGAVAVTASTGLAAVNIGGITLHSFAGAGLCKESVPEIIKKLKRNAKIKQRWAKTKILFIDEISMVDATFFDKLEAIAREIRKNARPFGGIQLVVTGDFFQLPPVPDRDTRAAKFSFEANTWRACLDETFLLTQVFRQSDPEFAGLLNDMRLGKLSPQGAQIFKSLQRPLATNDGLDATELFPLRHMVLKANTDRLVSLKGGKRFFNARDYGNLQEQSRARMLGQFISPPELSLKAGAQVMLIKNLDETLVNGSMGKIIEFVTADYWHTSYARDRNNFLSTGGLGNGDENLPEAKRVTNIPGIPETEWPLVRFQLNNGTTREILVQPETWEQVSPEGDVLAGREQIPLILAWALSIHKAQGQTLEKVKVDLTKSFEDGMAYVALSRATSKAGLEVKGFDAAKVRANPKVKVFYENLKTVDRTAAAKFDAHEKSRYFDG